MTTDNIIPFPISDHAILQCECGNNEFILLANTKILCPDCDNWIVDYRVVKS
jgi:hypothetical protein